MANYRFIFTLNGSLDEEILTSTGWNEFVFSSNKAYHLICNNCFVIEGFKSRVWKWSPKGIHIPDFEAEKVFGWNMNYLYREDIISLTKQNVGELKSLNESLEVHYSGLYHNHGSFMDPDFKRELIERLLA